MASRTSVLARVSLFFLLLLSVAPAAEAFDGGDAAALLLGMAVTVIGFCACLGWYARKRNGEL
ncbi:small integral membrane protein 30-like [Latimeria chalumnae]|uniref:small integral membrane protein 30-like n=1 Tax=Latimeria chalumnae TaxID=7897 RepID=UPI00313BAD7B